MSKPKLIILSGPLGSGKSTLAQKYADVHPLALNLDVDDVRMHLGQWREHPEESAKQSKRMAEEMARINLSAGYDVVIPQIYRLEEYVINLENIAKETQADFYEILLDLDKDEAIKRFMDRGGFHKGGLIEQGGGVKKLESMYDEMTALVEKRPKTIKIVPKLGDVEATYQELLHRVASN